MFYTGSGLYILAMYIEDNRMNRTSLMVVYKSFIRRSGMIVL